MSQQTQNQLKEAFATGETPTQQDFSDLIDSSHNSLTRDITGSDPPFFTYTFTDEDYNNAIKHHNTAPVKDSDWECK